MRIASLFILCALVFAGCETLDKTGDQLIRVSGATTKPIVVTTGGENPATVSLQTGALGAAGGALLIALGGLLKMVAASKPEVKTGDKK